MEEEVKIDRNTEDDLTKKGKTLGRTTTNTKGNREEQRKLKNYRTERNRRKT